MAEEIYPENRLWCDLLGQSPPGAHALLLAAALQSHCPDTAFKHITGSHVESGQEPPSNPQVPRSTGVFLRRLAPSISEECTHFVSSTQLRLRRHIIHQSVKKVQEKILHWRTRYSTAVSV